MDCDGESGGDRAGSPMLSWVAVWPCLERVVGESGPPACSDVRCARGEDEPHGLGPPRSESAVAAE